MVKKSQNKPALTLVGPDTTTNRPPRTLGKHGRSLWDRIQTEYDVSDAAGVELLAQACAGLDLAEQLHEEIERDGAVIRLRNAIREHPAIKGEIAARAFVVRTLVRLGLNFEPVHTSVGRPT